MLYVVVEPNSEVMFSLPGFDADGDKVCGVWGMEVQPVVDFVTTPCCPCWCPMDEPLHPIPWHCSNDNHGLAFVYLRCSLQRALPAVPAWAPCTSCPRCSVTMGTSRSAGWQSLRRRPQWWSRGLSTVCCTSHLPLQMRQRARCVLDVGAGVISGPVVLGGVWGLGGVATQRQPWAPHPFHAHMHAPSQLSWGHSHHTCVVPGSPSPSCTCTIAATCTHPAVCAVRRVG